MDLEKKQNITMNILAMLIAEQNIQLPKIYRNIGNLATKFGVSREEVKEVAKEALHKAIDIGLDERQKQKKDKKTKVEA